MTADDATDVADLRLTEDPILDRVRFRSDPLADPAATVMAGRARFQVLTDRLIRMQWSPDATFEDRASYAFPVRRGPVPAFTAHTEGDTSTIDTGALRLRWTDDGRPFGEHNLSVELTGPVAARWVPGTRDGFNLGGARRTVDNCRGEAVLEPGLASRSGWFVHDDSSLAVFDDDGWPVARRADDELDWYFFGYGHDYGTAVHEYTRFGGEVPLVPRWTLGAWWSRYHPYDEAGLKELVDGFATHRLPLSVVVIDMDWHLPDGWTGYTWNRELFPDPPALLAWLHDRGVRTTLNLHPAQGVQSFEAAYPEFARRSGIDPATQAPVPFRITDRQFVRDYFDLLHYPLEEQGVDFWWMDWQQGRTTDVPGLDPLPWLNHLHFADMARRPDRRAVDFSRWGALGSHRYPVGFSGDSFALWSALAFQPRYTAAGANVAYGWWSHDIGGHIGPDDPELYVRWVQFGAVSPVLRLHSNHQDISERRPWAFDERTLDLARAAFELRYELVPYLYTAARQAGDTAQSLVRPMAWLAPEADAAYLAQDQYLLGPDLLVAPVVRPVDPSTGVAEVPVWLPDGEWVERTTGESFTGPRWVGVAAPLDRIPQFVRPGTVLPLAVGAVSTDPPDELTLSVFPGADGAARVYDDDGEHDETGTWTQIDLRSTGPGEVMVDVRPGRPRRFVLRVEHVARPGTVTVDAVPTDEVHHADGRLTIPVGHRDQPFSVRVTGAGSGVVPPAAGPDATAPVVQILERTTPNEAARTLGRVILGRPQPGTGTATVRWRLVDGRGQHDVDASTVELDVDRVLDAPFAWDGTKRPCRWEVDVELNGPAGQDWPEGPTTGTYRSDIINPAITSWAVAASADRPGDGEWSVTRTEPDDIDFGSLAQRFLARFRDWNSGLPGAEVAGWARTTITVPDDREVAIVYEAGGAVAVWLDGIEVAADVTGNAPAGFFDLYPVARRTAPVHLTAGRHELLLRCDQPPTGHVDWFVGAWVGDPAGGELMLDVSADAATD